MTDKPQNQPQVSDPSYQDKDIRIRTIVLSMTVILVVAGLSAWGMAVMFGLYEKNMYEQRDITSPLATERQLPTEPLLQVDEAADIAEYERYMNTLLHSYEWVDITRKRVRIPINLAMDRVLEKGLPVREQPEPAGSGPGDGGDAL